MPVMDGYHAAQAIREHNLNIPIIALTANVMRGDRELCLAYGMNDYVGKPFKRKFLLETLEKSLLGKTNWKMKTAQVADIKSKMVKENKKKT